MIVGQSVPTSSTVPVSCGGRDSISSGSVTTTLQSKRPPDTTSPQYSQRSPPPGPNGAPQLGQWKLCTASGGRLRPPAPRTRGQRPRTESGASPVPAPTGNLAS